MELKRDSLAPYETQKNPTWVEKTLQQLQRGYRSVMDYIDQKKQRAGMTTVGMVLSAVALAGCATSNAQAEGGPEHTTVATAPATPTAEETPDATPTAGGEVLTPQEFTDEQLLALMTEPIPENLKPFETMTPAEFVIQPIEARLSYCSYLNRDSQYLASEWYKAYDNDPRYLLPEDYSKDDDKQLLTSSSQLYIGNAFSTHFGGKVYDRDTAQKIISCGFFNAGLETPKPLYNDWTHNRDALNIVAPPASIAEAGGLQAATATEETPSYELTAEDGKTYLARDVTEVNANGVSGAVTRIFVEYDDYKGAKKHAWVVHEK